MTYPSAIYGLRSNNELKYLSTSCPAPGLRPGRIKIGVWHKHILTIKHGKESVGYNSKGRGVGPSSLILIYEVDRAETARYQQVRGWQDFQPTVNEKSETKRTQAISGCL